MNIPAVASAPVEVEETALLANLDNRQLDHVALGLERNFDASLAGNAGEPESFFLVLETGQLVALHARTLTVKDVWDAAATGTARPSDPARQCASDRLYEAR